MSSSYEIDKKTNEMLFSKINTPDVTENSGLPFEYLTNGNEDFNKLIECPICLKILIAPKTCNKCGKSFCKNCIETSLKKNKNCPFCKTIFKDNRIIGQATRNQLDICKFNCVYKNKGCQEIISYANFFKHLNECEKGDYECNNIKYDWNIKGNKKFSKEEFKGKKCKFKGNKNDLKSHSKNCGLEIIFCCCCEEGFYAIDIKKHCESCYKKIGFCPYCKKEILLINYNKHIENNCDEVEINCEKCKMKLLRKNIKNHSKLECLENLVNILKNENIKLKEDNEIIKKNLEKLDETVKNFIQKKRERETNNKNDDGDIQEK